MCADRDLCSKRGSPGVSGSGGTRADSAGVRRRSAAPPHGPDRSRRGRPARDPSLELGIGAASGRESGSGSVLVVGAIAALVVVLLGMMALVAAAVAAQRVRTAAALAPISDGASVSDPIERKVSAPVTGGSTVLVDAVRALDEAQVGIADIVLRRPTLDDVFLSLTGHAAEDETQQPDKSNSRRSAR